MAGSGFLLVLLLGGVFASVILGPAINAGKTAKGPSQFYLSDIFSLLLLLQLPCAYLAFAREEHPIEYVTIVGCLLLFVVVFVWLRSVNLLSRIGVSSALRRGLFVVVILPVVILGALVSGPIVLGGLMSLGALVSVTNPSHRNEDVALQWGLLVGALAVIPICFLFRFLTRWVLAGAEHEEQPVDTLDDPPVE